MVRAGPKMEDCIAAIQTMPQTLDPISFRLAQLWGSQVGTCDLKVSLAEGTIEEKSSWVYIHLGAMQILSGCSKTVGVVAGSIQTGPNGGILISLENLSGTDIEESPSLNGTAAGEGVVDRI